VNEPGGGPSEPTSVEVERLELWVEVDVEPLATGGLRLPGRELDKARPDAFALEGAVRLGVEQERVVSAVPRDVHEADDRPVGRPGRDPAETVRAYLIPPAVYRPSAVRVHQADYLAIRQWATPAIRDPVD
jgi:hypothetical protein